MVKTTLRILGLVAGAAFLASCIIAVVDTPEGDSGLLRRAFHELVPFVSGGTVALDVGSGDVEIRGWEKTDVDVSAERSPEPRPRTIRIMTSWNEEPDVDIHRESDILRVRVRESWHGKEVEAVHTVLRVPHSVNLKDVVCEEGSVRIADLYGKISVEVGTGDLVVENFSGPLMATVKEGNVDVEVLDLRGEDDVWVTAKDGDITIRLQPGVNARLEASAPEGEVSCDFELKEPLPAQKLSAQLGEKGAAITLLALNGSIRILKSE